MNKEKLTKEELKRAIDKNDYIDYKIKEIETKAAAVKKEIQAMRKQRNNNEK